MSKAFVDQAAFEFIKDNVFPRATNLLQFDAQAQALHLVLSVVDKTSAEFTSWTVGISERFEINTTHNSTASTLTDTTVSFLVPGYGPAIVYNSGQTSIDLKNPKEIPFSIPNASVDGFLKFSYASDSSGAVQLDSNVFLPWYGTRSVETHALFEKKAPQYQVKRARPFTAEELSILRNAPKSQTVIGAKGTEVYVLEESREFKSQQALATAFIHDKVSPGFLAVPMPSEFNSDSKGLDVPIVSFLIFDLCGRIVPETFTISATLYARVPILGRLFLADVEGSLTTGVSASIDLLIAKGSITLTKKGKSLFAEGKVKIQYLDEIKFDGTEICTLPF